MSSIHLIKNLKNSQDLIDEEEDKYKDDDENGEDKCFNSLNLEQRGIVAKNIMFNEIKSPIEKKIMQCHVDIMENSEDSENMGDEDN